MKHTFVQVSTLGHSAARAVVAVVWTAIMLIEVMFIVHHNTSDKNESVELASTGICNLNVES